MRRLISLILSADTIYSRAKCLHPSWAILPSQFPTPSCFKLVPLGYVVLYMASNRCWVSLAADKTRDKCPRRLVVPRSRGQSNSAEKCAQQMLDIAAAKSRKIIVSTTRVDQRPTDNFNAAVPRLCIISQPSLKPIIHSLRALCIQKPCGCNSTCSRVCA